MAEKYSKVDKANIKKLKDAEIVLTGEETSDELQTLVDAESIKHDDDMPVQEEIDGVPNQLPVRTEPLNLANKVIQFPIFFVAAVKGGFALYNETGKRASPVYGPDDLMDGGAGSVKGLQYINKAAAKFNAMRRKNALPGDFK